MKARFNHSYAIIVIMFCLWDLFVSAAHRKRKRLVGVYNFLISAGLWESFKWMLSIDSLLCTSMIWRSSYSSTTSPTIGMQKSVQSATIFPFLPLFRPSFPYAANRKHRPKSLMFFMYTSFLQRNW